MLQKIFKSSSWLLGLLFFVMSSTGVVLADLAKGRAVSLQQAQKLVEKNENVDFPLEVNEQVVKELNRYLRTPYSRASLKSAFGRVKSSEVQKTLQEMGLPEELLVIPIIESAYENSKAQGPTENPAGVWQFTAETARNFGLKVNAEVDERLNIAKQTAAAAKLFQYHKKSFESWSLVVIAYNVGEGRLEQKIKKLGSKDPWLLAKSFKRRANKNYLAKVMALVVIQKNPNLLD